MCWLGYVQGVASGIGCASLDDLRDASKPTIVRVKKTDQVKTMRHRLEEIDGIREFEEDDFLFWAYNNYPPSSQEEVTFQMVRLEEALRRARAAGYEVEEIRDPSILIVPAPRPPDDEKTTFIRADFKECDTCRSKPGSPTLCADCLERRELWFLAERNGLLPKSKK